MYVTNKLGTYLLLINIFSYNCYKENIKHKSKRCSRIEVRSVFLNCDFNTDANEIADNSETSRFQREELFKHNSLPNCKKKLAVTVKMLIDPDQATAVEYIPIEHVLGTNNKRLRLLNPYILRLKREPPSQVYKLQKLDIVTCIFIGVENNQDNLHKVKKSNAKWANRENDAVLRENSTDKVFRKRDISNKIEPYIIAAEPPITLKTIDQNDETFKYNNLLSPKSNNNPKTKIKWEIDNITVDPTARSVDSNEHEFNLNDEKNLPGANGGNEYALFKIGIPEVWYETKVQLYEKLSTSDGKVLWNDLTRSEPASLTTMDPEWKNEELRIRYRTKDRIGREDFSLPPKSLCLILPLKNIKDNQYLNNVISLNFDNYGEFVIVPIDDIIMVKDHTAAKKTYENENSLHENTSASFNTYNNINKYRRQVHVRKSRMIMNGLMHDLAITSHGHEYYLKLPHDKEYHVQLDLEAKADDNKLVLIGSSGRLTTIVSDTQKKRSTVTLQVTNTGLAAAQFRAIIRECMPLLNDDQRESVTQKILIPPVHTKTFYLDVPLQGSFDDAVCSIALINDNEESVAIRDVRIKRGDRCFCVWHCECVCLSEDPKLLCRNMAESRLMAAGILQQENSRLVRAACYPDDVTLNIFVIIVGVILALLILGLVKATLGLLSNCISSQGLHLLLQMPRKLDHYHESCLRKRCVVYDKDGWPVHPDTKQRTVRLVSKPMEFILNVIFFVTLPCILIWDSIRQIKNKLKKGEANISSKIRNNKKCFSSQDIQSKKSRWGKQKRGLRRWMTPNAEILSTDIWERGLSPAVEVMKPLLDETKFRGKLEEKKATADSEQDDAEYVLMQIQKSRESLAKSQSKSLKSNDQLGQSRKNVLLTK